MRRGCNLPPLRHRDIGGQLTLFEVQRLRRAELYSFALAATSNVFSPMPGDRIGFPSFVI